jgi:hypothetical protein
LDAAGEHMMILENRKNNESCTADCT